MYQDDQLPLRRVETFPPRSGGRAPEAARRLQVREFFQLSRRLCRHVLLTPAMAIVMAVVFAASSSRAQPATGTIQDVQHVVVVMQENRSFDHYFSALKGVRGFNDHSPLLLPNGHNNFF